ncbi:PIN/TRAM domain-containing protein [Kurthia sibirica]|uniref:PIN domain nuclease n=1 Tax=Kurthia sibirica TaxID=202750 RepID=A0A2U3AMA2_9BACL|nr:PIN/TRAM domain-containing protein [Kurthia sibirica]PWI25650.1 PIN domain nuclease [Kurthia sibirica]GEK35481.1 putative PIN and TRAM-domain containing protein YacL [Kurthia sibirica]
MLKKLIQVVFLFIGGTLGLILLPPLYELINLSSNPWINNPYVSVIIGAIILFALSFSLVDPFVRFLKWMEDRLLKAPVGDLLFGTLGLIIGLIVAFLISVAIDGMMLPPFTNIIPIILSIVLGYLCFSIGFKKRDELLHVFATKNSKRKANAESAEERIVDDSYKLLDTSVIIDGRIADIAKTGFIEGVLVVPQFVLTELQHIADSSDTLKRTRGRRGLDILKALQDDHTSNVIITEVDFDDILEVDLKLVRLAKKMGGQILTNDFNLNKVCDLHKVKVLNINDLANAVKPVVIPGEEMNVVVIKDGKEHNQGVAYLDDGTMIVVEEGKFYIGQAITVIVTSVLQTSAGRMIFAKPNSHK